MVETSTASLALSNNLTIPATNDDSATLTTDVVASLASSPRRKARDQLRSESFILANSNECRSSTTKPSSMQNGRKPITPLDREKQLSADDPFILRGAFSLISPDNHDSPRQSRDAGINSSSIVNKTVESKRPPRVSIPTRPLVNMSSAAANLRDHSQQQNRIAEMQSRYTKSSGAVSCSAPQHQDRVIHEGEKYMLDHESYQESVVNEYLEKKYRECVLSGMPTLPTIHSVVGVSSRPVETLLHDDILVAASRLCCEHPSALSNEDNECSDINLAFDYTGQWKHEDTIKISSCGTTATSTTANTNEEHNYPQQPANVWKERSPQNATSSHFGQSSNQAATNKDILSSPTESIGASSIETVEKDVSDDYAPIDLTRASSDDLYKSFLGFDPQLPFKTINSAERADADDPLSFDFLVQTSHSTMSRVSPEQPQTHKDCQEPIHVDRGGTEREIVDHQMPNLVFEEYLHPYSSDPFLFTLSADAPSCNILLHGMSGKVQRKPFNETDPSLDKFFRNLENMVDSRSDPFLISQQEQFHQDDEMSRWYWDEQQLDHQNFSNDISSSLSREMIAQSLQHNARVPKRVSIDPSDMKSSSALDNLNTVDLSQCGFVQDHGFGRMGPDLMSEELSIPIVVASNNASVTCKSGGEDDPSPAIKRRRMLEQAVVSSLHESSSQEKSSTKRRIKERNALECKKASQHKRKTPHRNCNEPNFSENHKRVWLQHYQDFQEFVRFHGHGLVPHDYRKNKMLARWVKRQVRYSPSCNQVCFTYDSMKLSDSATLL